MPKIGDEARCNKCGQPIEYVGPNWRHVAPVGGAWKHRAEPQPKPPQGGTGALKLMAFAVGITARKEEATYHLAVLIVANNRDEASGKAMRFARRAYPPADGYFGHNVALSFGDALTDVDAPINLTTE